MGETAEEAIVREVFEETGVEMTVDRLAFVHENYFTLEHTVRDDEDVYEISFFFIMNAPPDLAIGDAKHTDLANGEYLTWIAPDDPRTVYPEFFRTAVLDVPNGVTFYSTDDRKRPHE